MFTSIEISLVRERNERLLREIDADRLGRRPRATRGGGARPRRFAFPFGRLARADAKGVA